MCRRDVDSAGVRARATRVDPLMTLESWGETAKVTYDRAVLEELVSIRLVEQARNAFTLGPVGVGKTFLASALGPSPAGGASGCTSSVSTSS